MNDVWRMVEPQAGMRGWLSRDHRHLRRGTPITVDRVSDGGLVAMIHHGREGYRRIYTYCLDCGREFRTASGHWIPESDPRVRRWLLRAIADIEAGGKRACDSDCRKYRAECRDDLRWVLQRNGWTIR